MDSTSTSTSPATRSSWERYQPWRLLVEVGFAVGLALANTIAGSAIAIIDQRRLHQDVAAWLPVVWEGSSNLMWLVLIPAVAWLARRVPLHMDTWRRALRWHLVGSVAWSLLHVGGMVALRKLAYATQGAHYGFSPWLQQFGYEYLKDVRSYAITVLAIEGYWFVMRRWQGEASLLSVAEGVGSPEPAGRPERFLVRKLGKEFLVAAADVEWLQASGNYVNLHVRGRDYPLRTTMAAIEPQLDPSRFARVHRSHIVNLDLIAQIEPLESGDASILMRDGTRIPCSRRHRGALRPA